MKNKIIFGLAILLLILFTNNTDAQEIGCCTVYQQNGERFYCGLASDEECIGDIIGPSCGSLNRFDPGASACETVSCQNGATGFSGNVRRIQCTDTGGVVGGPPSSPGVRVSASLERGGCMVDGECYQYVTRSNCEDTIGAKKTVEFDPNINSQSECSGWNEIAQFSKLGCCVGSSSCQRTFSDRCSAGSFRDKVRCDAVTQCQSFCGPIVRSCGNYGLSIIERDNCGVEKITTLASNEGCREVGDIVETFSKDCVIGRGKVTEVELLNGLRIEGKEADITSDLLGGTNSRSNGNAWCYDTGEGIDPGDSHYVLRCDEGSVVIGKSCGTFRDEICQTVGGIADCVENKWQQCMTCGQDGSWDNFGTDCGENECLNLGIDDTALHILSKSEKREISHCVFDTNGKNECWPKYPPGFEFWLSYDQASVNKVPGEGGWRCDGEKNSLGCGEGGDKRLNMCDENECDALGDCTYEPGHPYLGALGGGILYGGGAYLGLAYGAPYIPGYEKVIELFGVEAVEAVVPELLSGVAV